MRILSLFSQKKGGEGEMHNSRLKWRFCHFWAEKRFKSRNHKCIHQHVTLLTIGNQNFLPMFSCREQGARDPHGSKFGEQPPSLSISSPSELSIPDQIQIFLFDSDRPWHTSASPGFLMSLMQPASPKPHTVHVSACWNTSTILCGWLVIACGRIVCSMHADKQLVFVCADLASWWLIVYTSQSLIQPSHCYSRGCVLAGGVGGWGGVLYSDMASYTLAGRPIAGLQLLEYTMWQPW